MSSYKKDKNVLIYKKDGKSFIIKVKITYTTDKEINISISTIYPGS